VDREIPGSIPARGKLFSINYMFQFQFLCLRFGVFVSVEWFQ
jgi:hypothetical protein